VRRLVVSSQTPRPIVKQNRLGKITTLALRAAPDFARTEWASSGSVDRPGCKIACYHRG
jgi:hypothetical protein